MKTYKVPVVIGIEAYRVVRCEDVSDALWIAATVPATKEGEIEPVSDEDKYVVRSVGKFNPLIEDPDIGYSEWFVEISENDVVEVVSH